jgi:hypothetical protein
VVNAAGQIMFISTLGQAPVLHLAMNNLTSASSVWREAEGYRQQGG